MIDQGTSVETLGTILQKNGYTVENTIKVLKGVEVKTADVYSVIKNNYETQPLLIVQELTKAGYKEAEAYDAMIVNLKGENLSDQQIYNMFCDPGKVEVKVKDIFPNEYSFETYLHSSGTAQEKQTWKDYEQTYYEDTYYSAPSTSGYDDYGYGETTYSNNQYDYGYGESYEPSDNGYYDTGYPYASFKEKPIEEVLPAASELYADKIKTIKTNSITPKTELLTPALLNSGSSAESVNSVLILLGFDDNARIKMLEKAGVSLEDIYKLF